ncbi:MAG: hypothetical protein SGARI_003534, partial [Bacillariaceae sp.]
HIDKMSDTQEPKRKNIADGTTLRKEKRRKWEAKQERKSQSELKRKERDTWFQEHSAFATLVTGDDVCDMAQHFKNRGKELGIETSDEHKELAVSLAPYMDIQEKNENSPILPPEAGRLYIAEGTETVRVLLQQYSKKSHLQLDRIDIQSIFVKPSVLFDPPVKLLTDVFQGLADNAAPRGVSPGFNVLVGESENVLSGVAGFPITRGALACGKVPLDRTDEWLNNYLGKKLQARESCRILALDGICDTANLGSMIRTASALGVNVIVLSSDTCDAWYRRSIRVSMGHVFLVPIVRVESLTGFLSRWNTITSYAAVVQKEDSVALHTIPPSGVPSAWCCVFGNEGNGISKEVLESCTNKLRIEMIDGVDSLSVPIACGVLLHGLREREQSN